MRECDSFSDFCLLMQIVWGAFEARIVVASQNEDILWLLAAFGAILLLQPLREDINIIVADDALLLIRRMQIVNILA